MVGVPLYAGGLLLRQSAPMVTAPAASHARGTFTDSTVVFTVYLPVFDCPSQMPEAGLF
jgi:hypothetical protein